MSRAREGRGSWTLTPDLPWALKDGCRGASKPLHTQTHEPTDPDPQGRAEFPQGWGMGGGCLQQELGVACGSTPHPPAPTGRHRGHRLPHRAQGVPHRELSTPAWNGRWAQGGTDSAPRPAGLPKALRTNRKDAPSKAPTGPNRPLVCEHKSAQGEEEHGCACGARGATGMHVVGTYNRHLSAPGDGPTSRPGLLPEQARPPPDHTPLHGVASWPEADSSSICDSAQGEDSWERRVRANPGRQTPSASRPSR